MACGTMFETIREQHSDKHRQLVQTETLRETNNLLREQNALLKQLLAHI